MRLTILILLFSVLITACSTGTNDTNDSYAGLTGDSIRTIELNISDTSWTDVKSLLQIDSYVFLSSKVPIGTLERVIIENDYIYILDEQSRLVCFKPNGDIAFYLDRKGKGPGEFSSITDIVIRSEKNTLTIADQGRRKLIHYSSKNGKFISEEDLKVSVDALAYWNNKYYHYNPYHFNYPTDESMHYSLLCSENGEEITNRYFPHDPKIADYMYGDAFHQFSYNSDELYFRRRFIDTVYAITTEGVVPRYSFVLPDALPYSLVQQKPNALELATKSKYSGTLYNIFRSGNILHANFFNQNFVVSAYYDLEKDETIYCGKHVWPYPTKELPVCSLIDGVYNNKFFSLVSPLSIIERMKINPKAFSKDWFSINENSNPVLVFYKLVR